jgi:hypothetical protein
MEMPTTVLVVMMELDEGDVQLVGGGVVLVLLKLRLLIS